MKTDQPVAVSREDREAFKQLRGMFGPAVEREVDDGRYDDDWQMQLLAKHRLATRDGAVERGEIAEIIDPHSFIDIPFTDDPVLLEIVEQSKALALSKADRIIARLGSPACVERLREALRPLAALEVPKRPQGNAGAYSIRHRDIELARALLAEPAEGEGK